MNLNLTCVPVSGGATLNICLGFTAEKIHHDGSGIHVDVRVFDAEDPTGPSQIFPARLPAGTPDFEVADRAVQFVAADIQMQTELWKRLGRLPGGANAS
jgi:hypothetical protein